MSTNMTNLHPQAVLSATQHDMLKELLSTMPIYQPSLLVTGRACDGNNNLPTGIINPNNHLTNPQQCGNLTFSNTTD